MTIVLFILDCQLRQTTKALRRAKSQWSRAVRITLPETATRPGFRIRPWCTCTYAAESAMSPLGSMRLAAGQVFPPPPPTLFSVKSAQPSKAAPLDLDATPQENPPTRDRLVSNKYLHIVWRASKRPSPREQEPCVWPVSCSCVRYLALDIRYLDDSVSEHVIVRSRKLAPTPARLPLLLACVGLAQWQVRPGKSHVFRSP